MPVVNGLRERVGVGYPSMVIGDVHVSRNPGVLPADGANVGAATEDEWLSCPVCGRQAVATEWPEVRCGEYGSIPGICPDCEDHNIHSVPVPARKRDGAPKVVNGHVLMTPATCSLDHEHFRVCPVCDGGLSVCMNCPQYEAGLDKPCLGINTSEPTVKTATAPPARVAAVVVRGLGGGETARVVLCRSEIEAVREQQRNGGIVVAGDQVVWA